jgi:hypothetical protein
VGEGGVRPAGCAAVELRARSLAGEIVDDALMLVERTVDAEELLARERIGRAAIFELLKAGIVGLLERLERTHEILEGGSDWMVGFRFELLCAQHSVLVGRG